MSPSTLPELPGMLAALAPILNRYGYVTIATLITLEDFGVPCPGETVLIIGAVYAGAGRLNVVVVALLALVGAVVGDNIGYLIGRRGGRRLLDRYGRYVLLTHERVDSAERFFVRFGGGVVVVARFIEGLRQVNGIIAGMTGMRWPRFLAYNVVGAMLWVGLWLSVGYLAGAHIDTVYPLVIHYEGYLYLTAGVAIFALVTRALLRRRRRRGAPVGPVD